MSDRSSFSDLPGVVFYGPIGVMSGLGAASRGYASALRAAKIPTSVVPVHELFVHQPSVGEVSAPFGPSRPVALVDINADSVHRFLHFHGKAFERARYKIALWAWELPALRDEWFEEIAIFDEFWAPSAFVARAIRAMTEKPVMRAPFMLSPQAAPRALFRERFGFAAGELVFLYIFDASSGVERKNPQCLVEAFEAEFAPEDRVRLVLKASHTAENPHFSSYLEGLVLRNPKVTILRQNLAEGDLAGLIAASDCYVSPHRSEGFGVTVAEAMLAGTPVIATAYGGVADFVTEEVGFPLRYRLKEVGVDYGPYSRDAVWAEPSREHLRALLRSVAENPADAARRAARARDLMQERFSAEAIGRLLGERLAAIAALPRAAAR